MKRRISLNKYLVPRVRASAYGPRASSDPTERYRTAGNADPVARYMSDVCTRTGKVACGVDGCAFNSGPLERRVGEENVYIDYNPFWSSRWDSLGVDHPDLALKVTPVHTGWVGEEAFCTRGTGVCGEGIGRALVAVSQLGKDWDSREYEEVDYDPDRLQEINREALLRAARELQGEGYNIAAYVDPLYIGRYLKDGDLDKIYRYPVVREIRDA